MTTSSYYAAPDGSIDYAAFIGLLHAIGIDRILFSVDYPYSDNRACKRFLENCRSARMTRRRWLT